MEELTEQEYEICLQAVVKCHLLRSYVKSGLHVTLTDKNFGFAEITDEEETVLINKLNNAAKIAWLKNNME